MSFAVDRIDHVEVFVSNLEASARWYADVLGLTPFRRWDPEPLMIEAGGTRLALFVGRAVRGPADSVQAGWHRVAWRTTAAGFAQAQAHLNTRGVSFEGPVDHGGAWSIYFSDPDSNPLEITHYEER